MCGLMFQLQRIKVEIAAFEEIWPEFTCHVRRSWQTKFDIDGNSYVLIIDECQAEDWMLGESMIQYPILSDVTEFFMVKFDNIINKVRSSDYSPTPRNDKERVRLSVEGLTKLFSYVMTAIEQFGNEHNVQMFVACAYRPPLERYYRYLLTHSNITGYDTIDFVPANEQAHFAFCRRQG